MITTSHSFYFILCISRAIISDLLVFTFVVIMRHKPTVIISDVQKNMKISIPLFFLSCIFFLSWKGGGKFDLIEKIISLEETFSQNGRSCFRKNK